MTATVRERQFWISTVSLDHVQGAIAGGFTQADHGANTRLKKMRPGDRIVYYSPRTSLRDGSPLQQFTALAQVTGDAPYQVTVTDDFQPWRLDVRFEESYPIDAKPLVEALSFITDPSHWGFPFRRGLFTIPEEDYRTIADAMAIARN
ncbi:EVE domain-containing protein [soil metagenome]